jgi:osmotically-inducible protein OsmY
MNAKSSLRLCFAVLLAAGSFPAHADGSQDEQITTQVKTLIIKHPDLGTQITVNTKNGTVYLTGKAANSLSKANAEDLARSVSGVKDVVDNIGIEK